MSERTYPGTNLVERYIRCPAHCIWVLAWIPADEPYSPPPPGAQLHFYNPYARSH